MRLYCVTLLSSSSDYEITWNRDFFVLATTAKQAEDLVLKKHGGSTDSLVAKKTIELLSEDFKLEEIRNLSTRCSGLMRFGYEVAKHYDGNVPDQEVEQ